MVNATSTWTTRDSLADVLCDRYLYGIAIQSWEERRFAYAELAARGMLKPVSGVFQLVFVFR